MEITITMPQLGESVSEGVIGKWLKKAGDRIEEDEPLVEVITDKITAEVPSSAGGVITSLLAKEGDTVGIGAPICIISSEPSTAAAPEPTMAVAPETPEPKKEETGLYPAHPERMITAPKSSKKAAVAASGDDTARLLREKSSPLVRRILAENSLDLAILANIKGTGVEGRVTKEDVLAYVDSSKGGAAPYTGPSPVGPPTDSGAVVTPLAGIRKIIAERLSYSEHVAPHVTTFTDVDVSDLVALRTRAKDWAKQEGVSLTYLAFVIKAVCAGLRAYPAINSSLIDNQLYAHKRIHIAIAVSLDQAGLILPVIRDADTLSILDLARAVQELAERARANKLTPMEIKDSTFTISNPGAFGGWISTPIINQPNAAILNTGKIQKMPWVMPDDSIVARSIMFLSLSYDHRIVDGETSVKFLQFVKQNLEQVERFLLR